MRIALTVGHSILKNGCITSADGTKFGGGSEYKFNKTISKYVAKELRKNGHDVDVIICPEKLFTASTQEKGYFTRRLHSS
jgi:N-acetylmuramoyl-L-alanine amidase